MSVIRTLLSALAGTVSADAGDAPPADPRLVRSMLTDVGLVHRTNPTAEVTQAEVTQAEVTQAEVTLVLRQFQAHTGLETDGVAGPQTMHVLVKYAREARRMRELGLAA